MQITVPEGVSPEVIAKRMFWLAWNAAGRTFGAGFLRDRPEATEDQVWVNVQTAADYPGPGHSKPGKAYGDYVFGRMVKLLVDYTDDSIGVHDDEPQADYQAWCCKYSTYKALAQAAIDELAVNAARG